MADILIRGMKMPDSCEFCRFHGYGGYEFERVVCSLTGSNKEKPIFSRFDDCPLVELPAHGDLIDADALKAKAEYDRKHLEITGYERELLWHYLDVSMAPVIVPASEEVADENP